MSLAFLVPVLGRPHRVVPLLDSIATTTPEPYRVYFIVDYQGDDAQREAVLDAQRSRPHVVALAGAGAVGYAAKINLAVCHSDELLIFLGADDLTPQQGWLDAAKAAMAGGVEVVGVNDMIERRPGREGHATHFLMTRAYAERPAIDGATGPLSEAYDHSFVDDELIATATKRGVYAYAPGSLVRHDHPMAGGTDDDTYRKGRARFRADRNVFHRRSHLWA